MTLASYRVVEDPTGATEFQVSPASAPLPVFNLLASSPFVIFGWKKNSTLRTPMNFRLDRAGVAIGDTMIPAAQIHRLILRNHVTEQEVAPDIGTQSTVIVGTPGAVLHANVGYGLANMGASAGRVWYQKRAKVSWRLDAGAGGRATTLACGMDETTAYGLLQDASKKL